MEAAVVVVCAMEAEAVHLRRRLAAPVEAPLASWRRTRGRLGRASVDVLVCGIGLVSAAAAASALCVRERPRALLNYGCAGAHRDDLHPGDVVLGERVVHVSSELVLPSGERRHLGFDFEGREGRIRADALPADPGLLAAARAAAAVCALPPWPGRASPPGVHAGPVASADVWTQHAESIRALHARHGSLCEEMEAAALAQVAAIHGVPFLAVKDISNNELQAASPGTGEAWPLPDAVRPEVGRRAALVVEALLETWAR